MKRSWLVAVLLFISLFAHADKQIYKQYEWGMSKRQVHALGAGRCGEYMCAKTQFAGVEFRMALVFAPYGLNEVRLFSEKPEVLLPVLRILAANNYDQIMVHAGSKSVDVIEGLTAARTEVFDEAQALLKQGFHSGDLAIMYIDHASVFYALKQKVKSASQVMLLAPRQSRFVRIDLEGEIIQVKFRRHGLDGAMALGEEPF